jgi:chromosome segregation protein
LDTYVEHKATEDNIQKLVTDVGKSQQEVEQTEDHLQNLQTELQQHQEVLSDSRTQLATSETQLEQAQYRAEQIQNELETLNEQLTEDKDDFASVQTNLDRVTGNYHELEQQRAELISQRDKYRNSLDKARASWQQTHEESHGIALQLESISSQRASLEQSLKRSHLQITHLQTRCKDLLKALTETKAPIDDMQKLLANRLKEKVDAEKALAEARTLVQQSESELREQEQKRNAQEHHIQELREKLENIRLTTQECRVRLQTIEEQLKASNHKLQKLLVALTEDAAEVAWREKLKSVARKINRLGPINLAAIDEYTQLSERKTYLDNQNEDLEKALNTLENAIRKIDKESRTRFKDTFDRLNSNLQEVFPQLFGGGHATLELIGDDLLETGVTIMARPPGKRNSNIHLLSGGEKALTAVALIFSIFKLNPAPFCILDEVDAPLDDANVARFSELVSKMSSDVQFIFITHNKITMEIAHQLLGVTMHEAGISRLVSVDVDEAVKMAATA